MSTNDAAASADLTSLVRDLNNASRGAKIGGDRLMDQAAQQIQTRMVAYAPKRTGRLAQSITITKTPGSWTIGPVGVTYAVYQEFGTATRGEFGGSEYIIRPKNGGLLHFKIDGRWVSAKEVHHPGIPPHPFARPAAQEVIGSLADAYADMGVNLVLKGRAS